MTGETILHFKILEEIGRGGMGVVYRAEDTKLGRIVALKFLSPALSATDNDRARFVREARSASALDHPNICTIHDIQDYDGPAPPGGSPGRQMFIVMQYVEGRTLRQIEETGPVPLPMKQSLDIAVQIADGLAAAHEKGIVHRDIKPENIMVRRDGIVQIMDFGLAIPGRSRATRLTGAGSTVGTAGYMSPEQVQGQDVDHRSDIFSLGVLFYELFAGRPAFRGVHDAALTYEIVNVEPTPISALRPGIDPEVDRLVKECMQKDPAERVQSAAEIAKDLRRLRRSSEGTHTGSPVRPRDAEAAREHSGTPLRSAALKRWLGGAALMIAGAVLCAAVLLFWGPGRTSSSGRQQVGRFVLPLPPHSAMTLDEDALAISPDGRYIAFIADDGSGSTIYLRDVGRFDAVPLQVTAGLHPRSPFFSPDAAWLGFFAGAKMMKVSLAGGTSETICEAAHVWGHASWGERGNIVFMKKWGAELYIVSSDAGSVPRPLTNMNFAAGERAHLLPVVLPGGKEALFTIWRGGDYGDNLIAAVDLETGVYRTVLTGGTGARYLAPGRILYTHGSTLMAAPFDVKSATVSGESIPVVDSVLTDGANIFPFFAVSENGTLAYVPGDVEFDPMTISLIENGSTVRRIETGSAHVGIPRYSPDGRLLSLDIFGPTYQVGVYDLRKSILTQLTFAGDNARMVWYPDGSRLAFGSNIEGLYQIYTVAVNGGGKPARLFDSKDPPYPASWSRDSKNLAYVVESKETGTDIWVYSPGGSPQLRPLIASPANESSSVFSPDGRWIAYVSDESGRNEVYVQPFPSLDGRWRVSDGGGIAPRWGPDGRRILFSRQDDILSVPVSVAAGRNGPTIVLGKEERILARPGLTGFDVSPNGRTIAVSQAKRDAVAGHINVVINWGDELNQKLGGSGPRPVK